MEGCAIVGILKQSTGKSGGMESLPNDLEGRGLKVYELENDHHRWLSPG